MRILLAPMEGLLDHMLRETLTADGAGSIAGGVDLCVAEFIRITNTLLPASAFYRVVPELKYGSRTRSGVPVRVQLLGSDPVCMADNAARAAELGAYGIDLNFGCPANTVNRHRGGAILLREPELMYRIVAAVREAVPPRLAVTAKMRLGYDTPDYAVDCAQALAAGGAREIAVHARTKTDGYKPPAYWEWIARVREAVAVESASVNSLPIRVVANGEIWNADDARRCREISGCTDIMIGRGMVANPALARMIRGDIDTQPRWSELLPVLHGFWQTVERNITPRHRNGRIKQWLLYLSRNYPQAQRQFDAVRRIADPDELNAMLFDSHPARARPETIAEAL